MVSVNRDGVLQTVTLLIVPGNPLYFGNFWLFPLLSAIDCEKKYTYCNVDWNVLYHLCARVSTVQGAVLYYLCARVSTVQWAVHIISVRGFLLYSGLYHLCARVSTEQWAVSSL